MMSDRERPASIARLTERIALAERFFPGIALEDDAVSVFWQRGCVCGRCAGRRPQRTTELRPVSLGVWWCPTCRASVGVTGVLVLVWGQDDPIPASPRGRRLPQEEMG